MPATTEKGTRGNPYSQSEYESLSDAGTWSGGYVKFENGEVVYVMKEISVSGYCSEGSGSSTGSDTQGSSSESSSADYDTDEFPEDEYGNEEPSNPDPDPDSNPDSGQTGSTGSGGSSGGGGGNAGGGYSGGGGGSGGGGSNTPVNGGEADHTSLYTYTEEEAENLIREGKWKGGYVTGCGYVMPEIVVLPSVAEHPSSGEQLLARALKFKGVPYLRGGVTMAGIDCSGLVTVALGIPRWTTQGGDIPTTQKVTITGGLDDVIPQLEVGDILVWKSGGHCCIYAGEGKIFHAHGSAGDPTGYTNDLRRYWIQKYKIPAVYRIK